MEKEEILGIKVCNTTYEKLREYITKDIKQNKKSFIVTVNPEKIVKANKDESLKKILNEAEYQIPDGIGIIYASKIKKGKLNHELLELILWRCYVTCLIKKALRYLCMVEKKERYN